MFDMTVSCGRSRDAVRYLRSVVLSFAFLEGVRTNALFRLAISFFALFAIFALCASFLSYSDNLNKRNRVRGPVSVVLLRLLVH